jgi:hypothetical protein
MGAVIALLAAGCAGNTKPATSAGSPTTTGAGGGATVAVRSSTLGKIQVDDQGRML